MGAFPTGSPKDFVRAVSDGFQTLSVTNLRKFQPAHLKMLLQNILILEREIRSDQPASEDFEAIRKKNFRLGNLTRARLVINEFIRARRINMG
ncbi:hypothetical protein K8I61_13320 [bacterium]|nr:hypothetical protein [bacterium]